MLVTGAGIETTSTTIANIVYALCTHPDALSKLEEERELIDSAVDETLRWLPPGSFRMRYAAEDVELHGVTIPRGALIYAFISSANRDRGCPDRRGTSVTASSSTHFPEA